MIASSDKTSRFAEHVAEICRRAVALTDLDHTAKGTDAREDVVAILNHLLTAEQACVVRYHQQYDLAKTIHGEDAAKGFMTFAEVEQTHVNRIAERIQQLGGTPESKSNGDSASYVDAKTMALEDLAKEDILAEGTIVDTYSFLADWLEDRDPVTAQLVREIRDDEETHLGN